MLGRIGIHFGISFIYILTIKNFIIFGNFQNNNYLIIGLCFLIACVFTLLLEAWHYLIIDLVNHYYKILGVLIIVTISILLINPSLYMVYCMLYLDIMAIGSLYQAHKMDKALKNFQKQNNR